MACNGHCNHCPNHSGYSSDITIPTWVTGNEQDIPTGGYDPDSPSAQQMHTLDTSIPVKFWHFNWMAWYIDYEIDRWGVTVPGWKDLYDRTIYYPYKLTDDLITAQNYKELRDAQVIIRPAFAGEYSHLSNTYLAAGEEILDESTDDIRDEIDNTRGLCVCDCNYSCTCDCNYCTCNCNHGCQCNCNF